ncbi:hypothetical protein [Nostoc sp.]|uniref:hypothetical protein n=1 Tax=Nostoc sp. TaxID=1180 RepID=UPI002FFD13AB
MARLLHQPGDAIVDSTKQPHSDRYRIINILGERNSGMGKRYQQQIYTAWEQHYYSY